MVCLDIEFVYQLASYTATQLRLYLRRYIPEASHMESSLDLSLSASLGPADESKNIC